MQNEVLESSKYPEIAFESTHIDDEADGFKVNGNLTLHGVMRPVLINVKNKNGIYVGSAYIKQTDFDIRPIQVGGGLVKVKDELEIKFAIYLTRAPAKTVL